MPELPEVESLCRQLRPAVVGRTVTRVELRRPDVVRSAHARRPGPADLLEHRLVRDIRRHGKQMLLVASQSRHPVALRIHLGMTGNLLINPPHPPIHTHILWTFDPGLTLAFVDPRRFGGIWVQNDDRFPPGLGPDALRISPAELHDRLSATSRPIKAALLDQTLVAGLGNIYTDELLFACRIHPLRSASRLTLADCRQLVRLMRRILRQAGNLGGSTLRDYRAADGQPGGYQQHHRIYGKSGQKCPVCGRKLEKLTITGRTTTTCPQCQPCKP